MKTQRITLPIYNLGCAASQARSVEQMLAHTPGVAAAYVNPATEMAYVEYNPAQSDPGQLFMALERAGYGPKLLAAPRETTRQRDHVCPFDAGRLALAAGIWLAALYAFCIVGDLLFPGTFEMSRLWSQALVGVDPANGWTLPLGLLEAFVYGVLGGWTFATLYNRLPVATSHA